MAFYLHGTVAGTSAGELYTFTAAVDLAEGDLCVINTSGEAAKASASSDGPLFVCIADVTHGTAVAAFQRVDENTIFYTTAAGTPHAGLTYALDATNMQIASAAETDVFDIRLEVLKNIGEINGAQQYAVIIHPAWDVA